MVSLLCPVLKTVMGQFMFWREFKEICSFVPHITAIQVAMIFWVTALSFFSIFMHGRLNIKTLLICFRKSTFILLNTIINLLIYVYIFHRHVVYIYTKIAHFISMSVMLNIGKLAYLTAFVLDNIYDHKLHYRSEL